MKKWFLFTALFLSVFSQSAIAQLPLPNEEQDLIYTSYLLAPIPKRSGYIFDHQDVREILSASVRVTNHGSLGSGTICYYDHSTKTAYVISCGHLFNGSQEPGEAKKYVNVEIFYKDKKKLAQPIKVQAEVICHTMHPDISFLKFKLDWEPTYIPIAPKNYKIRVGEVVVSIGCDHGSEPAVFVSVVNRLPNENNNTIQFHKNSALPGRSGGGLITKNGYYGGVVITVDSFTSPFANTQCTSLYAVRSYASKRSAIAFLLNINKQSSLINNLPIKNENGDMLNKKNYILVP